MSGAGLPPLSAGTSSSEGEWEPGDGTILRPLPPRLGNGPVDGHSSSYAFPNPGADPERGRLGERRVVTAYSESHARQVCIGPLVRKKACSCHPFPHPRPQSPRGTDTSAVSSC